MISMSMFEVEGNASGESFYKAKRVRFDADNLPLDQNGDRIFFAHWAGAVKLPKRRVFDAAWLKYAETGAARVQQYKARRPRPDA